MLKHAVRLVVLSAVLEAAGMAQAEPPIQQNTAVDAAQIIEMKRQAWSRQQRRDPAYFAELRQNLSKEYIYKEANARAGREQYLKDVVNTHLESFELSDFEVTFLSPVDAVMTHKALFKVRGYGKSMVKSCYYTTILKKANGVWYEKSYTGRAAK